MSVDQCAYMVAAYPDLTASDTCDGFHDHTEPIFALARALAVVFQNEDPTDEQIAWFLNDAQAVASKSGDDTSGSWEVGHSELPNPRGCDFALTVNGVEFVLPAGEWDPTVPELRSAWLEERDLTEGDLTEESSDEH